jgi:hypothetical protein
MGISDESGIPTARYFHSVSAKGPHFKPDSDSGTGLENPSTLQKGTETFCPAGAPNIPKVAGISHPAFMDLAEVMVTFGMIVVVRLSQVC